MSNNTNPLPEISALVLAALLVIGGVALLYVGKIDFVAATLMFGSALALFGGNLALKAPSPAQQGQINAQQQQLTQVVSQMQAMQAQPPVVIHNNIPAPAEAPAQPALTVQEALASKSQTTNQQFQSPIPMQPGNTYPYPVVQAPQ